MRQTRPAPRSRTAPLIPQKKLGLVVLVLTLAQPLAVFAAFRRKGDQTTRPLGAAAKGGVVSLTRSLAVQFGPQGIRTNAICPGPVETPLLMDWLVKDEAAKKIRLARNPTGRFGKPEEIVHMAVYLASDESRWTNGASLVVDGGITVNYF